MANAEAGSADTLSTTSGSMYLREFSIQGFRSCASVTVPLQPTLTLLVGENNAGKSNVIEALRLATTPLSGRKTRYFDLEDCTDGSRSPILLTSRFAGLSRFQRAHLIGALELETGEAVHATRFRPPDDAALRGRVERLVGTTCSPDPEPEKREQINHVYLEPLRNAQSELDSASGNRLAKIMRYLVDEDVRESFVADAQAKMADLEKHPAIVAIRGGIQGHLTGLTDAVREQVVEAGFDPPELRRLARSLRLKMADKDFDPADLSASGLGYANLLFMATVILELQHAQQSELTLFLVEEPEAHLHPQLQAVLLEFLMEQAEQSVRDDADGPAGRIQVIATTHSPNLASAVGTNNVVAVRTGSNTDAGTAVVPLSAVVLQPNERRKIDQYLDVTRSELLFGRKVILVEGIAEAVLLPVLAKHCIFEGDSEEARRGRRAFRGISIINVGSVDFTPYIKLLLGKVNGHRLVDRLVVITDTDPDLTEAEKKDHAAKKKVTADGDPADAEDGQGTKPLEGPSGDDQGGDEDSAEDEAVVYNRASDLTALGQTLDAGDALVVAAAPHTLEADLLVSGTNNDQVLGAAYLDQHPRSRKKWASIATSEDPARAFYVRLRTTKKLISKGQFAHDVARRISSGAEFICPDYLIGAVMAAAEGRDL